MASEPDPLLNSVFNHIVLPPKLPTTQDGNQLLLVKDLQTRLLAACDTLRKLCQFEDGRAWDILERSVRSSRAVHGEFLDKEDVRWAFDHLENEWLLLHIEKQNAALLVHRDPG